MRKWFHTELFKLGSNEERLRDFMVSIDAHSRGVAVKLYVLQAPADDAKLAK